MVSRSINSDWSVKMIFNFRKLSSGGGGSGGGSIEGVTLA